MKILYVDTKGEYVISPYKVNGMKCKCKVWLKSGGIISEWFNVSDMIYNHVHYGDFAPECMLTRKDEIDEEIIDKILVKYEEYKKIR